MSFDLELTGRRALVTAGTKGVGAARRFLAGADVIAGVEQKIADLRAQIEANRELSTSLTFD